MHRTSASDRNYDVWVGVKFSLCRILDCMLFTNQLKNHCRLGPFHKATYLNSLHVYRIIFSRE
jgi:hypothetical protein